MVKQANKYLSKQITSHDNLINDSLTKQNQMKNKYINILFIIIALLLVQNLKAQIVIGEEKLEVNYASPKEYTIGGITVTGTQYINTSMLISISELRVGNKIEIPSDKIKKAIENIWKQGLFEDVKIVSNRIHNDQIFLDIIVTERPRLSKYSIVGVRKGEATDLRDKLKISRGDVVTDNLVNRVSNTINSHYKNKGFSATKVNIVQEQDTSLKNFVNLKISINKGKKVRIEKINIYGNDKLSQTAIKSAMKKTKEAGKYNFLKFTNQTVYSAFYHLFDNSIEEFPSTVNDLVDQNIKIRVFKGSKFLEKDYEEDKQNIIRKYHNNGFIDAQITEDTVYNINKHRLNIDLHVNEGNKYYYRDITFAGNTKFNSEELASFISIEKGDVYNLEYLETVLNFNPSGVDLMSLFADDGYLTCNIEPVIMGVENDSIDMQIRIREGKQMRINKVTVSGNTRTNDKVIIRELASRPGQLFSRSDILRSRTSLSQLKYFNAETMGITPTNIDPNNGTVDIAYSVEETSSDQLELSGGWGFGRFIGTLGVSFNNFSTKKFFKKESWKPIPSGDGQRLSLRGQSYGRGYYSISASFVEPWLGGKRPNQFSVSIYNSNLTHNPGAPKENLVRYNILGFSVGLSRRLNWPDNYFSFFQSLNLQQYRLSNYSQHLAVLEGNGLYQNYSYTIGLSRYSNDAPIYPRVGSEFSISVEATPPYSIMFPNTYEQKSDVDKYRLVEFHQWKLNAAFYQQIVGDLVLMVRTKAGFIGKYNPDLNITAFNRYFMGGDGMSGYGYIDGRQIIGFRGYENESLTTTRKGASIYNKSTLEIRYPLTLNPNSTIYASIFVEAGNTWDRFKDYNPFNVRRSAGVGLRVWLPMFGLLGLDWGYGFDPIPGMPSANKGQFHFSINSSID